MQMVRTYSPFRYPGGKTSIAPYLKTFIEVNGLPPCTYAEPYAGGAGAALKLLFDGTVSHIYLNDKDPHIFAVWNAILNQTRWLTQRILNAKLNIEEWKVQRDIYNKSAANDTGLDVAFATLYLNRCNRSGIIKGGVIGGLDQSGVYKMDARFKKENIIKAINDIKAKKKQISISNIDAISFLDTLSDINVNVFIYLDPPYYKKGKELYLNFYNKSDHLQIADKMQSMADANWLMSYDDVAEVEKIYQDRNLETRTHNLLYSLRKVRSASEILIKSPACVWPAV